MLNRAFEAIFTHDPFCAHSCHPPPAITLGTIHRSWRRLSLFLPFEQTSTRSSTLWPSSPSARDHVDDPYDIMPPSSRLYEALPLANNNIRHLRIRKGQNDDPVNADLELGPADDKELSVISYCWGTSDERENITVNGEPFRIRTNAFAVMKARRSADHTVKVWIDEVCLDQGNRDEMKQQFANPARVYQAAKLVVVWLGELGSATCPVATLQHLAHNPEEHWDLSKESSSIKALNLLFDHSWFARTWTFFESIAAGPTLQYHTSRGVFYPEDLDAFLASFDRHVEKRHCCGPVSSSTTSCPD